MRKKGKNFLQRKKKVKMKKVTKMVEVYIVSEANHKFCLDVEKGSEEDGANVILYELNGNPNQIWTLDETTIKSVKSGKVLDIEGGEDEGHKIIQHSPNGGDNQKWYWHPDATIRSEHGLCLDIEGGKIENKTPIIALPCNGGISQKWKIVAKQ